MTSALSITRSVAPPRAAFLDFPLGHTTGKKNQPEMQLNLMRQALAGFEEIDEPGTIRFLAERWSEDESWRQNAMAGGGSKKEESSDDSRTPRLDTPQYQYPADRDEAERLHHQGACGSCVGAE